MVPCLRYNRSGVSIRFYAMSSQMEATLATNSERL